MERSRKISVICTVRNEIDGLDILMSSILNQTLKPAEMVVVDGGSDDGTWGRLQDWEEILDKVGIKLKTIRQEGTNIAEGRNVAIEEASGEWIASIDGGCAAESNWLEEMAKKEGDVVSGNFRPVASGMAEKIQAVFVKRSEDRNPSSRSIMFRKSCWREVGGYPENLYTGEDTAFNSRLAEAGCRFATADGAVVNWRMRSSLWRWLKQFYLYGFGDGRGGIDIRSRYGKKIALLIFGAYMSLVALIFEPSLVLAVFAISLFYSLSKSLSVYGLLGGLVFPFRLMAYVVGLHMGILNKKAGEGL